MVSDYNQGMRNLLHKASKQPLLVLLMTLCASVYANDITSDETENDAQGIIIQDKNNSRIQEFRSNGQVYMIKITPNKGFPYYLVDTDGDGLLESRKNGMEPNLLIPSWVIFSW